MSDRNPKSQIPRYQGNIKTQTPNKNTTVGGLIIRLVMTFGISGLGILLESWSLDIGIYAGAWL